ncbi:hypothetical protein [Finegoldia magna]|uniref:Uncharacterized protein n=1 Tax=Finegoldia magna (strain ATCC 29328 / DSM 20472 / WAL 2508) TaxID=334413 RepID=B0S4N3_FINM2|nr:hypothetical protein [Finegoldia magna]UEA71098.1 hypothetical protein LK415_09210 [Finegoldia magna]BAG09224.1 hypothetical protein FMG_P0175 [Finegoldia magna ATCC 29328]
MLYNPKYIPDNEYVFDIDKFDDDVTYDYEPPKEDVVKLVYYEHVDKYGRKDRLLLDREEWCLEDWKESMSGRNKGRFDFIVENQVDLHYYNYISPQDYIDCLYAIEKDLLADEEGCIYIGENVLYNKKIIKMVFEYLMVASGQYETFLYDLNRFRWNTKYAKGNYEGKETYYCILSSTNPVEKKRWCWDQTSDSDLKKRKKFSEIERYLYSIFDSSLYEFQLPDRKKESGGIMKSSIHFNSKYGRDKISEVSGLAVKRARTDYLERHLIKHINYIGTCMDYEFINEVLDKKLLEPTEEEKEIKRDFREKYGLDKCSNSEERRKRQKELSNNQEFIKDAKMVDSFNRKESILEGYQYAVSQYFLERNGVGKLSFDIYSRDIDYPKEMSLDNLEKYYIEMKEKEGKEVDKC